VTRRRVSLPADADTAVERFVSQVDDRFSGPEDTCEVVRETLVDLSATGTPTSAGGPAAT
jgi:hypothetical protein